MEQACHAWLWLLLPLIFFNISVMGIGRIQAWCSFSVQFLDVIWGNWPWFYQRKRTLSVEVFVCITRVSIPDGKENKRLIQGMHPSTLSLLENFKINFSLIDFQYGIHKERRTLHVEDDFWNKSLCLRYVGNILKCKTAKKKLSTCFCTEIDSQKRKRS